MGLNLKYEKKKAAQSSYNPTQEEHDVTMMIARDYEKGHTIMNKPYEEYNFLSIVEESNANRKAFNSFVPEKSNDPDESWRAQTIRPIVRAKLISIAAHVTTQLIIPKIFAQDGNSDEDKAASEILGDLLEWAIDNSNYERSFINAVITALVDPAVYVHQEFREVMRTVKFMSDSGEYEKKEILDTVLSGFSTNIIPVTDLYFDNIREPDIQRQRFLLRRRTLDYAEAEHLYSSHQNFKYVKPGVQSFFVEGEATFFDQRDTSLKENQVEIITYWNRLKDMEITLVNGIIVTDTEQPLRRLDKKYPIAKSGYEPINDGQFFLYKSAANKIGYDEDLINELYNYVMDGTFLSLMPPMAVYGQEDVDGTSVMVPGATTKLRTDTKLDSLAPRTDLRAGLESINLVERSIAESTSDSSRQGVAGGGDMTAFEVATLEQNAKTQLGLFGKFIGFLVKDLGDLLLGDIIQFVTVPEIKDITDMNSPLKYKSILVPNRIKDGKKFSRKIEITEDMLGSDEMSQDELFKKSLETLEKEGINGDVRIAKVNPHLIRSINTKVIVDVDQITPRSKSLEKAMKLELYDRAIGNPTVNIEAVTRDFLFEPFESGSADKYIKQKQQAGQRNPLAERQMNPETGGVDTPRGVNGNLTGQITGSNSLKNAQLQE